MYRPVLLILLLSAGIIAYSQKIRIVSADYTYYAPETMSIEEAKRTSLERAKIQAIADEFGTTVSQSNSTIVSNKNGESNTQFFSYGGSEVKGEWIETIGEPVYDIKFENHFIVVSCFVKGKAREIESAKIDFIAKPLRNGTTLKYESTEFKDGDDLYLYFKSPIDGYISVYLFDEIAQTVYCILPYKAQAISAYPIKANKEYITFSQKDADRMDRPIIDEYTLSCENDKEFNTLYILFSPSNIGKGNGFVSSIEDKPDNISYKEYKQWLSKTLSKDKNLQFQRINISISK